MGRSGSIRAVDAGCGGANFYCTTAAVFLEGEGRNCLADPASPPDAKTPMILSLAAIPRVHRNFDTCGGYQARRPVAAEAARIGPIVTATRGASKSEGSP
jgi:hypothetical protein